MSLRDATGMGLFDTNKGLPQRIIRMTWPGFAVQIMFFPSHPPVSIRKYFRKSAEEIEKSREKQINDLLKANQQLQEQVSSMTQGPKLGFFQSFFFLNIFPIG